MPHGVRPGEEVEGGNTHRCASLSPHLGALLQAQRHHQVLEASRRVALLLRQALQVEGRRGEPRVSAVPDRGRPARARTLSAYHSCLAASAPGSDTAAPPPAWARLCSRNSRLSSSAAAAATASSSVLNLGLAARSRDGRHGLSAAGRLGLGFLAWREGKRESDDTLDGRQRGSLAVELPAQHSRTHLLRVRCFVAAVHTCAGLRLAALTASPGGAAALAVTSSRSSSNTTASRDCAGDRGASRREQPCMRARPALHCSRVCRAAAHAPTPIQRDADTLRPPAA